MIPIRISNDDAFNGQLLQFFDKVVQFFNDVRQFLDNVAPVL